jgi:hypothetical protein
MVTPSTQPTKVAPASYIEVQGQYTVWWERARRDPFAPEQEASGTALFLSYATAPLYPAAQRCPHHHLKIESEEPFWGTAASAVAAVTSGRHFDLSPDNIFVMGRATIVDLGLIPSEDLQVRCVATLRDEDTFLLAAVETADPDLPLAKEFGISAALFRWVKAIVSRTIGSERGLSLSVERLVDREIGRPIQLVFEVRGAASAADVTRIWEAIDFQIDALSYGLNDADLRSLVEDISVHVHRA